MQSQFSALGALHVLQGLLFWALLQRCHAFQLDGTNKSYAKFPAWEPCLNGSFSFDFMTGQPYALLVYLDYGGIHFLELKLIRGSVQLRANFGEGTVTMLAGENLDDSRWHAVEVRQDNERTVLTVDGITHVKSAPGKMADFRDVTSKEAFMFVGGLPVEYESRLNILAVASVVFEPRFKGSIRNLFYRFCGREQHRPEIIDSGGLLSVGVELCERGNPCLNGGVCLTTNSGLVCDCARTEFKGERCDLEKIPSDATFFGAQYFTYNLSGQGDGLVSNRDSISLDFRTKHPDGLLFYTGNVKDYLNIAIRDGAIILAINLGSGSLEREIRPSGPRFDDNLWHQVVVRREAREISLEVDGIYQEKGSTTGNFKLLSSKALYVAGSPDTANLPGSRVNANFRGCMRKVRYRADSVELDLTELARAEHALLKVIGGVIFDKCQELVDSRPITFTTPESYLTIPVWSAGPERGSLAFQFQTVEQHGVLLYSTGAASGNPDVFALELLDGYLHLVINMGSEPIRLKASRQPVTDGSPHMVYFEYAANRGYISVDGQKETFSTFSHLDRFDLQGSFFIGGISKTAEEIPLPTEMWAGTLGYGYVGCLQDMVVDGGRVDLVRAAQIQGVAGVAEYCQAMEPHCTSRPCMHQGQCTEGWNRFTCDCRATGFIDSVCQTAAATLRFDGKQFVKVTVPEESHTQAEDISLRFRTMHPNGLLFMTTSERAEDKMELYLKSGSIFLGVDVGSGHKVLSVGHSLNDDRWHTAYIKRRAQTVELKIDVQRPVTDILPGPESSLFIKAFYVGYHAVTNSEPEISRRAAELEFRRVNIGDVLQDDNKSNAFSGFIGSMQQFIFNRNQFFDMARSEKIEVTAKLSTNGHVMHDPVTFKSTDAYAVLPRLQIHDKFSISFQLKTTETDGLLMYNPGRGQDFFAMEMTGGFLYYVYNMGAGTQRIRANVNEKLSDNKWHEVQLLRTETYKQLLRVDDKTPTVDDLSGSSAIHFDLQGHLYIGGVRKTMYHTLPKKVEARFGFMGCIDSLYLNGYMANIHRDANPIHESVVDGCQAPASQCQNDSCANGGRCVQQWNSFSCDCDMTSFSGPTCQAESTTYRFGPGYGLIKFAHPAENLPSTNRENLALGFKTRSSDAVLVRIDSATYDDYIELELNKGNIVAVYNMGTMDYPIGEMFDKVNDGKYHVVRFTRSGPNSTIQVDNLMMQTKMPRGQQAHTFNNQAFVYIGGKQEKNKTVSRPFQGTISGLVLNGIKILDLARQGDKRISLEGNVTHVNGGHPFTEKKSKVDDVLEMQSTQGVGMKSSGKGQGQMEKSDADKLQQANHLSGNWGSALQITKWWSSSIPHKTQNKKHRRHILQGKATNQPSTEKHEHFHGQPSNPSAKQQDMKKKRSQFREIHQHHHPENEPENVPEVSEESDIPTSSLGWHTSGRHLTNGGIVGGFENTNTETEEDVIAEKSSYNHEDYDYDDHKDSKPESTSQRQTVEYRCAFSGMAGNLISLDQEDDESEETGFVRQEEGSADDFEDYDDFKESILQNSTSATTTTLTFLSSSEKGGTEKVTTAVILPFVVPEVATMSSLLHVTVTSDGHLLEWDVSTTPQNGVTDEIIFSGGGPCPYDDEDDCTATGSGTDDDIITPSVIIKTTPPPPTTTTSDKRLCKEENCPHSASELEQPTEDIYVSTPEQPKEEVSEKPTGDTNKTLSSGGSSGLNLGLIIGIAVSVLVAVVILCIALYKFRSRDEGTYKVDESQNFTSLDSKKSQQGNGTLLSSSDTGKRGGKKKDVKEWYV